MPLPTFYATGSASVANGATTITFTGALLGTEDLPTFRAGDLFFDPAQPLVPGQRLASVDYAADPPTAELWVNWPGTSLTADPYEVRFTDDGTRSTAQTRRYLEMLGQLARLGIQPDAFGEFSDRDEYDDAAKGFIFLSLNGDAGDTTTAWTLYIKLSGDTADWDDGQTMEGAPGDTGPPGADSTVPGPQGDPGPANTLEIGTVDSGPTADAEITGTAPNQTLNLVLPQGDPGTDGEDGTDGANGWSPVFAVVNDSDRRVLQVADWQGGEGTKPTTGLYVGATGLTATIGDAVDIRGLPGANGTGTVASVVGGTGIDVDDTDPNNPEVNLDAGTLASLALADSAVQPGDLGTAAAANTGTASGNVPVLNGSGKLENSVVPAVALVDVFVVASQAAMLALSAAEQGDVAIRTDINKSFVLSTNSYATLADWKELLTPTDAVLSVAGKTGAVTLVKGDVGLGNVDNTSDATKNAATATLTNKRITERVTAEASSTTPTFNTDNCDTHRITALAVNITSMTTNMSGTPTHGQKLIIEITGTATRTISWGESFEASTVALPTTTDGTNTLSVGFKWNSATSKWRCIAVA